MNTFKKRLQSGETLHGCWLNMGSPVSAEIVGQAGFDWVLIDLEHGAGDIMDLLQQLQAVQSGTAVPFARVDEVTRPKVGRFLDAGSMGIMFPQIKTAEEAATAVSMLYYQPRGIRGLAKMVRASRFGVDFEAYDAGLTDQLVGIIQIETLESLDQLDRIAALEGVDVLFVGPADLSRAMGISGQFNHPRFLDALDKVANAASKAGKACGTLLLDINYYDNYYSRGFRFIACGSDSLFVLNGARAMTANLKSRVTTPNL